MLPSEKYANFDSRVLPFLKQKLDRWAINLAANALPPGKYDAAQCREAARLLASRKLLEFPDVTAELVQTGNGAFHFDSSVSLKLPRNDCVHGKLFQTDSSWRSRPLVILVHGWNAELHYLYILPRLARSSRSDCSCTY